MVTLLYFFSLFFSCLFLLPAFSFKQENLRFYDPFSLNLFLSLPRWVVHGPIIII